MGMAMAMAMATCAEWGYTSILIVSVHKVVTVVLLLSGSTGGLSLISPEIFCLIEHGVWWFLQMIL